MIKKKKEVSITELLPDVKKNILLKNHTTIKIGGRAKYFFVAKTKNGLISAINTAEKINLPFFILGNGSNLLISDEGYQGLVIKIKNEELKTQNYKSKFEIFCGAGTPLSKVISESFRNEASGLEWAIGIPGTIGGAVRGNAGAFGKSLTDNIQTVEVYDVKNKKIRIFKNKNCHFSYRNSIFKKKKNLIIISAALRFKKGRRKNIENKTKEYLDYRRKHQPLNFPSAGSIFLNPKRYSAGELIEKCGLKGKKIRKAQVSEIHANFIVNLGGAKASDVKKLINLIKEKVKQKFGLILKEEIVIF